VLAQQADCTTGAGQLDLAVYRPSNGVWQVCERGSSAGNAVTRDYNGDGRTELAVWRPLGITLATTMPNWPSAGSRMTGSSMASTDRTDLSRGTGLAFQATCCPLRHHDRSGIYRDHRASPREVMMRQGTARMRRQASEVMRSVARSDSPPAP
jgi:hypothetical protein